MHTQTSSPLCLFVSMLIRESVLPLLLLRVRTVLISRPSILIEAKAEVKAQVVAEAKIRIRSITRVMDVEEDNKTLEAGGDMEIRVLEIGSRIQILM